MIITAPNRELQAGTGAPPERRRGGDRRRDERRASRDRRAGTDPLKDLGLPRLVETRTGTDRRSGIERRQGGDRRRIRAGFVTPWQLPGEAPR